MESHHEDTGIAWRTNYWPWTVAGIANVIHHTAGSVVGAPAIAERLW